MILKLWPSHFQFQEERRRQTWRQQHSDLLESEDLPNWNKLVSRKEGPAPNQKFSPKSQLLVLETHKAWPFFHLESFYQHRETLLLWEMGSAALPRGEKQGEERALGGVRKGEEEGESQSWGLAQRQPLCSLEWLQVQHGQQAENRLSKSGLWASSAADPLWSLNKWLPRSSKSPSMRCLSFCLTGLPWVPSDNDPHFLRRIKHPPQLRATEQKYEFQNGIGPLRLKRQGTPGTWVMYSLALSLLLPQPKTASDLESSS